MYIKTSAGIRFINRPSKPMILSDANLLKNPMMILNIANQCWGYVANHGFGF